MDKQQTQTLPAFIQFSTERGTFQKQHNGEWLLNDGQEKARFFFDDRTIMQLAEAGAIYLSCHIF